jgi:hypothetical protein
MHCRERGFAMPAIRVTEVLTAVVLGVLSLSQACTVKPMAASPDVPEATVHYHFGVAVMNAGDVAPPEGELTITVRDAEDRILATAQAKRGGAVFDFDSARPPHHVQAVLVRSDGTIVGTIVSWWRVSTVCMHLPGECLVN